VTAELSDTAAPSKRTVLTAIGGLGVTQIIGWGTTFSSLTIFGTTIGSDMHVPRETVFAGITVMLLMSALIAPRMGRLVDTKGARPVMMVGSVVATFAMVALAFAQGVLTYLLAWVLVGVSIPMMLANAALAGLVQIVGSNARRAITGLMLLNGLTGTIFLPLNAFLIHSVGWRNAYLIFAAMHLLICLPIHALILKSRAPDYGSSAQSGDRSIDGLLPPEKRKMAFAMIAVWSCSEGLITWGLYMQVIDVFKGMGLSAAAAISVWAMVGPSQASARFGELMFGGRYSILMTAILSAILTSGSFLLILPFGASITTAAAFSICIGLGHGFFAIARNTLPLMLFGAREYGTYMGRLLMPQNVANAAAPVVFAMAISRFEPVTALWLASGATLTGLVAVIFLVRTCRVAGSASV
jgi:predicted MFS family arabinose efflux permease